MAWLNVYVTKMHRATGIKEIHSCIATKTVRKLPTDILSTNTIYL
uniref:Uncharacterized protein n=1 Tax=Arundo donax TaxID=35708 RepID=A0A0A9FW59_ARUDO